MKAYTETVYHCQWYLCPLFTITVSDLLLRSSFYSPYGPKTISRYIFLHDKSFLFIYFTDKITIAVFVLCVKNINYQSALNLRVYLEWWPTPTTNSLPVRTVQYIYTFGLEQFFNEDLENDLHVKIGKLVNALNHLISTKSVFTQRFKHKP